jgi:hypothetical protein
MYKKRVPASPDPQAALRFINTVISSAEQDSIFGKRGEGFGYEELWDHRKRRENEACQLSNTVQRSLLGVSLGRCMADRKEQHGALE